MARRHRRRGWQGEFGTSLADILTTALGCVLLLFMVVVLHIKATLHQEKAAHGATIARLETEETEHQAAEEKSAEEMHRRAAVEARLRDEAAARGEAQDALRANTDKQRALEHELASALEEARASKARYDTLRDAAAAVVKDLDPRTASPVDVMLVIDGTGSMQPSLDATRDNLQATLDALRVVSPTARIGVVVFRDKRERKALKLQSHPLTGDDASLKAFLAGIEATSTWRDRDLPEWLCGGIAEGVGAAWRDDAIKIMIVVSDASAQDKAGGSCFEAAAAFKASGGQLHVVSTHPRGYGTNSVITRNYKRVVLKQHAQIAERGGGLHVRDASSNTLLASVLHAAFRTRTEAPLDKLRKAVEGSEAVEVPEAVDR